MQPLQVVEKGGIEDAPNTLQADFANEYIGGGVLCGGNVQEEIRFSICPECLVSMLLCPRCALLITHDARFAQSIAHTAGMTTLNVAPVLCKALQGVRTDAD